MKENTSLSLAIGLLIGAMLTGGTSAYAVGTLAERSTNRIFVDGREVQMEAYAIGGNNYVKLRDVGKAVGFNVSWDGSAVQIDSDAPYQDEAATAQAGKIVSLPTDGRKYVPKAGALILCDAGAEYEITAVSRWNNNVYQTAKLPPLPAPKCDWSKFPVLTLPEPEVRHYHDQYGDDLFVRNVYEVRRMVYTIYNALGKEPSAWRDGKPLATVSTVIPPEYEAYTAKSWPWNESNLTDLVQSRPNSRYYVDAFDFYHDGAYQYTRYLVLSL